jgi:hypothetical protein
VQVDPGILLGEGSFAWSPKSDALVVQGMVNGGAQLYDVRGSQLWKREQPGKQVLLEPWIVGFIDPGHLLAHHVPAKGEPDGFETLDLQGQVVDTWTASKQRRGGSINSDRHLLAVFSDFAQSELLIIDYPSKKVMRIQSDPTWLYRDGARSALATAYFAENGKTICTVGKRRKPRYARPMLGRRLRSEDPSMSDSWEVRPPPRAPKARAVCSRKAGCWETTELLVKHFPAAAWFGIFAPALRSPSRPRRCST